MRNKKKYNFSFRTDLICSGKYGSLFYTANKENPLNVINKKFNEYVLELDKRI